MDQCEIGSSKHRRAHCKMLQIITIHCHKTSKGIPCKSLLRLQDILLMVGPYGDWVKYNIEEHTLLVSECDGVRLISAQQHELLSRVPDSQVDVFRIGSTAPGNTYMTLMLALWHVNLSVLSSMHQMLFLSHTSYLAVLLATK